MRKQMRPILTPTATLTSTGRCLEMRCGTTLFAARPIPSRQLEEQTVCLQACTFCGQMCTDI